MSAELSLYAEFTARAGQEDAVASLLARFALDVRAEPGNVQFAAHRKAGEPRVFFVYEVYRDEAAFQAHLAADSGRAFNEALDGMIVEDGSQLTLLTQV